MNFQAKHLYKNFKQRAIVKDVSITLGPGRIVGLLGPNGAGKTTCFYMLCGLIKPDKGTIHLQEQDITNLSLPYRARLGVGYLPQENSVFKGLSVENNILAALECLKLGHYNQQERLEQLLDMFSLTPLRCACALTLSGGERRRVEIARALAFNPSYLLMDEPFAGVDPIAINETKEIILNLKKLNIGIFITDHNVREILDIVDHAYIMVNGSVLTEGKSQDIILNNQARALYLGEKF